MTLFLIFLKKFLKIIKLYPKSPLHHIFHQASLLLIQPIHQFFIVLLIKLIHLITTVRDDKGVKDQYPNITPYDGVKLHTFQFATF